MVLLHGYPQTGHMWRKVMPALAERFTVVAPDLRGYGDSDRPIGGYDKRTMAADVADVIRALGIEPIVLVGIPVYPSRRFRHEHWQWRKSDSRLE
jgi:haloacetate dehalogenase